MLCFGLLYTLAYNTQFASHESITFSNLGVIQWWSDGGVICPSESLQCKRLKSLFSLQEMLLSHASSASLKNRRNAPVTYFLLHFFTADRKTALFLQNRGHLPEQCQEGINYGDNNSHRHMVVRPAQEGRTPLFSHLSFAPGEASFLDSSRQGDNKCRACPHAQPFLFTP